LRDRRRCGNEEVKDAPVVDEIGGNWGIHWFRRDLRVAGNAALGWSRREHSGRTVGLFAVDPRILSRPDFSPNRFGFLLETLASLRAELVAAGSDLLVLGGGPEAAFARLLETLQRLSLPLPRTCSFNRDYEPFARGRDTKLAQRLRERWGIVVHSEPDHLVIEPQEMTRAGPDREGGPSFYRVYTPFAKRWFEQFRSADTRGRIEGQQQGLSHLRQAARGKLPRDRFSLSWPQIFGGKVPLRDQLETNLRDNQSKVTVRLPASGSAAALAQLCAFKEKVQQYALERDLPGRDGTSRMSIYFKNGSFTPAMAIAELGLQGCRFGEKTGPAAFLREIVWREFYYSVLYHCPRVETGPFLPRMASLAWENREDLFEAWKEGRTGYPIVDAGMRQLRQTGWMHNRVRMIVASFLTKDLLIDWRWGENHFMRLLLDGDLAANNGGWQWAASTGTDPQPYFRIFNPVLQSRKFDPDGQYIRRYVPELRALDARRIHEPWESGGAAGYPGPIVDHAERRAMALSMYAAA
jgi:deoxyribodipyrimidine photo-lyase